jgi:hypothetical protein
MYTNILRRLRRAVKRKCPEKCRTNSWFLLYHNASAHRSVLVKDLLVKNNVTTPEHLPYSPDLALAGFYSGVCYNEQFLSIKSGCYNEHRRYNERGGLLSADIARA